MPKTILHKPITITLKPKASQANVYYDFAELVSTIQANPSGEFRLGQSMSARRRSKRQIIHHDRIYW
ncbi:MAG: ZmpA/ZmpB/ZmpC family metallo-endopeptidase-related protein [Streptococcus salivarius]